MFNFFFKYSFLYLENILVYNYALYNILIYLLIYVVFTIHY